MQIKDASWPGALEQLVAKPDESDPQQNPRCGNVGQGDVTRTAESTVKYDVAELYRKSNEIHGKTEQWQCACEVS